jgi:hypothetical protein
MDGNAMELRRALEGLIAAVKGTPHKMSVLDRLKAAEEALAAADRVSPYCLGYATRLAIAIHERCYKQTAPEWMPFPDLLGVLTQIDNMTAGMDRVSPDQGEREKVARALYEYEYKFPEWNAESIRESTRRDYRNRAEVAIALIRQPAPSVSPAKAEGWREEVEAYLWETFKAVLHFYGPEGAEKISRHVLMAWKSRTSNAAPPATDKAAS